MKQPALEPCAEGLLGHNGGPGRRQFLRCGTLLGASLFTGTWLQGDGVPEQSIPETTGRLLDEIERRACRYFYEEADPHTGLVRDRARVGGGDGRLVASIAATGFGLSALAVADARGYLPPGAARRRAERTLESLARSRRHKHGFYYHFLDMHNGERAWGSEISSVDTAWLLCGALHARAHFDTPRLERLASELIQRVDWRWMLDGGRTLSHGWTPEHGFLPYRWDAYAELLAMYLLAIGSGSAPIPASSWDAWARPERTWEGLTYIDSPAPLFVHQYSHAWFDFRGRRDRYADYFRNSTLATIAHRKLCIGLASRFPWYGPNLWGVTASDSKRGYQVWPASCCPPDGTLTPCAAGGSVAFLPHDCGLVLETMLERYGTKVWGRYGFVDAFEPGEGWYSGDVIGINQGIMLLMAENARSEGVWRAVMSTPEAGRALELVGLNRTA